MKRSPLKRKTPLKRGGRLKPFSKKRSKANAEYLKRRAAFLAAHPWCQWSLAEWGSSEEMAKLHEGRVVDNTRNIFVNCPRATEIHHRAGRIGPLLMDETKWMAVCRYAHRMIHDNPKIAKEKGYLLPH